MSHTINTSLATADHNIMMFSKIAIFLQNQFIKKMFIKKLLLKNCSTQKRYNELLTITVF